MTTDDHYVSYYHDSHDDPIVPLAALTDTDIAEALCGLRNIEAWHEEPAVSGRRLREALLSSGQDTLPMDEGEVMDLLDRVFAHDPKEEELPALLRKQAD